MAESKPFCISKWAVYQAWMKVRDNQGAAGVDGVSIEAFERKLKNNLYRIWNRMSSGSYVPPPVRRVTIPKADGGERPLGIPTVGDRVAQMVVKMELEPKVEPLFHPDSYGYRPGKSALDAVGTCRARCWRDDWIVDLDIKGFFDNIDHSLMMHAVRKHTDSPWVLLYIERWLKAPVQAEDGTPLARDRGTPQGGVISPLLANVFLHHVFDEWMTGEHPDCPFERYADDVVIHCRSKEQAMAVRASVEARLRQCRLEAHPDKTRIVYCRDGRRQGGNSRNGNRPDGGGSAADRGGPSRDPDPPIQFDFLGYSFRPRQAKDRRGKLFCGFIPAIATKASKAIVAAIRGWGIHRRSDKGLAELARMCNPAIRGWLAYYGRYYPSALHRTFRHLNRRLVRWAQQKYKRFRQHQGRAWDWLRRVAQSRPGLFAHWAVGVMP